MRYSELKKELLEINKKFNKLDAKEIDYFLSFFLNKNLFEIRDYNFTLKEVKKIKKLFLNHLKKDIPLQKLFKRAYFYKREFFVNNNVLTPRFDSEILIENVLKKPFESVLDLCCGSGALGITLKKERENISIDFADISKNALKVTKRNCKKYSVNANLIKTNMFKNIDKKYDLIICNPPYIETNVIDTLNDEVKNFDPSIALDGGEDGLKFYNIILNSVENYLTENGKCILEIGYNQGHLVEKFKEKFKNVELIKDYNNQDRAIYFERR